MVATFEGNQAIANDRVEGKALGGNRFDAANPEVQSGLKNFTDIQSNMRGPDTSSLANLQLFDSGLQANSGDNVKVADSSAALKGGDNVARDASPAKIAPDVSTQVKDAAEALDPHLTPDNGATFLERSLTDARQKFGADQEGFNKEFVPKLAKALDDSPQVKAQGNSIELSGLDPDGIRARFDQDGKAQLSTFRVKDGGPGAKSPQEVIKHWNSKKLD